MHLNQRKPLPKWPRTKVIQALLLRSNIHEPRLNMVNLYGRSFNGNVVIIQMSCMVVYLSPRQEPVHQEQNKLVEWVLAFTLLVFP